MGAFYNPTQVDPRLAGSNESLPHAPAGVGTNYGVQRSAAKDGYASPILAQGKGTGVYVGGNVAQLSNPADAYRMAKHASMTNVPQYGRGSQLRHAGSTVMENLVQDSVSPKRIGRHDSNPHAVMNINLKYGSLPQLPQLPNQGEKYSNRLTNHPQKM